ncbi:hypothetical protein [Mucilaginibacter defluvii]|uniref:Uncharacterized protein n=1 Tax=Mucilaginibacter defluvii TaxID=1196019 RepID=A0ABP9FLH8_9SPHI
MAKPDRFPGFFYEAAYIEKYYAVNGWFSLLLADGRIHHFMPEDPDEFLQWLKKNNVFGTESDNG